MRMKRKSILLVTVLVLTLIASFSMEARPKTKIMRVGNIVTPDFPHHIALQRFAELVKEKTDGSIEVQLFPNSQLGNALVQIQSVRMGTLEGFIDGVGWFGQLVSDYYILATAYIMRDMDHCVAIMNGEIGNELAEKLRERFGLKLLSQNWWRAPRNVISTKPLYNADDVEGIRMRVPELACYVEPWKAMGASPTAVAMNETYLALQQGVVDAMECPLDFIYTQKFHEVAKYVTRTEHIYETSGFVVNERWFNNLTDKEQKALLEAAKEAGDYNNRLTVENENKIVDLMEKEGVTFINIDKHEFFEKIKNIGYDLEKKGLWPKGLYDRVLAVYEEQQ